MASIELMFNGGENNSPPSLIEDMSIDFYLFGFGGGGYSPPPKPEKGDPCREARAIATNNTVNLKNHELKGKTKEQFESGYTFDKGYGQNIISRENKSSPNNPDGMKVLINSNTIGYNHTHIEKNGVIHMFSPNDISTFVDILRNAKQHNIPLNEVFSSMVFRNKEDNQHYVYQLTYSGDGNDIPKREFTESELDKFKSNYQRNSLDYLNEDGYIGREEGFRLFFNTLKDMGLGGINLSDITNINNPINITQQNGEPKETKCK
jgi:hypothetical protein